MSVSGDGIDSQKTLCSTFMIMRHQRTGTAERGSTTRRISVKMNHCTARTTRVMKVIAASTQGADAASAAVLGGGCVGIKMKYATMMPTQTTAGM